MSGPEGRGRLRGAPGRGRCARRGRGDRGVLRSGACRLERARRLAPGSRLCGRQLRTPLTLAASQGDWGQGPRGPAWRQAPGGRLRRALSDARVSPQPAAAMPFSNSHNTLKLRFPAEDEFPDLSSHNNHMAKVLTPELYAELRAKSTPSGFTLDDVIQTGVDNPGTRARPGAGTPAPNPRDIPGASALQTALRAGVPAPPPRAQPQGPRLLAQAWQ